jgi:uncharacterized Zn finger protein
MARAKQAAKAPADQRWRTLTWGDLEDWAGLRAVERGEVYHREGRVQELARTRDGGLLAWVQGTARYATRIRLTGQGRRRSVQGGCTCPLGDNCKHGVAVVLAWLDGLREGREVPLADRDDPRHRLLEAASRNQADQSGKMNSEVEFVRGLPAKLLADVLLVWARVHPDLAYTLRRWAALPEPGRTERLAVAVSAEAFLRRPGVETLRDLERSAERAGCGKEVSAAALRFLETGERPTADWPWPPLVDGADAPPPPAPPRPHLDVLLDRAVQERKPGEVLYWFDRLREERRGLLGWQGSVRYRARIADVVADALPAQAEALLREALNELLQVNNSAADEATLPLLRQLRGLWQRQKRGSEWERFEAELRRRYPNRWRLGEVLDRVVSRVILEG